MGHGLSLTIRELSTSFQPLQDLFQLQYGPILWGVRMSRYDSQRAVREPESSALVISGVDVTGAKFQEESQTINLSETGIAFYMKTSVWMDAHLNLEVLSSPSLGPKSLLKAKVVRFGTPTGDKRLVAARFD